VISAYHWLLERFPSIDAGVCSTAVPCELVWFEKFGFITLPFMAFTAFAAVLAVTTLPRQE
jgi:disulfide bond formation protein DsbB